MVSERRVWYPSGSGWGNEKLDLKSLTGAAQRS